MHFNKYLQSAYYVQSAVLGYLRGYEKNAWPVPRPQGISSKRNELL